MKLPPILPAPDKPQQVSESAQWIAGEGAGSWIQLKMIQNELCMERYSPQGILECSGVVQDRKDFDINAQWDISYPSHCAKITIVQDGRKIELRLKKR